MDILQIALKNQKAAYEILETTGIIPAWQNIEAIVNIVGSTRTGLMMKKRDIDLHIYTDKPCISESFSVMQQLAEKLPFQEIQYRNLLDTEEECIEWHALYQDKQKNDWKFDMIHIRKGSKYDGFVEKVTDALIKRLTPENRRTILQIKSDVPDSVILPGIEIYHAVLVGGVQNYADLMQWREKHPLTDSMEWIP